MQSTLIQQGLDLMLFGMGTVFVFLALLVVGTMIMSTIVEKFFSEPLVEETEKAVFPTPAGRVDSKTLAIIQDAILQHRKKQKK